MGYKITKIYYTCMPGRMPEEEKKRESEVGRLLLAHGLRELYGLKLSGETIARNRYGKPYLENHPEIQFNISHSGDFVICAVGPGEVGIDIEKHRSLDFKRLARKAFLEEECRKLEQSEDPMEYFFDTWTLKEAYLKWKGIGISKNLKELQFEGWGANLPITDGYSAAIWSQRLLMMKIFFVDYQELLSMEQMK